MEKVGVAEVFVPILLATTIWFVIILPLRKFIKRKEFKKHAEVMLLERQAKRLENLLDLYGSLDCLDGISDEEFEKLKVIRLQYGFKLQQDDGNYINELEFIMQGCTKDIVKEIFINPEVLDLTVIDRFVDRVKKYDFYDEEEKELLEKLNSFWDNALCKSSNIECGILNKEREH